MRTSTPNLALPDARERRFQDVLAHIDAHLDDDLSLARLSRIAGSSAYHFHRQFSAHFGVGVHRYVKLARLRRAAFQLLFRQRARVVDVALASGYQTPESFSRAFKNVVGRTPSEFRARPDWPAWNTLNRRLLDVRSRDATEPGLPVVTIEHMPAIRVAALELRDRPIRLAQAVRSFIAWRIENGLPPQRSATYSVFHDPLERTAIDLCAATQRRVLPNPLGVVERWLPSGRCAVLKHIGSYGSLFETTRHLYTRWLPASGEKLRAAPLVIRRITLFPDVAEHQAESEVFLPLQ